MFCPGFEGRLLRFHRVREHQELNSGVLSGRYPLGGSVGLNADL